MYILIGFAIVIGSAAWVFTDAKKIGVKKGQLRGFADMSPTGWLIGCLLLWIIAFPLYITKRGALLRANDRSPESTRATISGLVAIAAFAVVAVLGYREGMNSRIEEAAMRATDSIPILSANRIHCIRVRITDKVTDEFYNATATLDNGKELPISIFVKDEQIAVRVRN